MANEIDSDTGGELLGTGSVSPSAGAGTGRGGAIPEVWRQVALLARYAKSYVYPKVMHMDEDVRQFGDIINIRILPTLTVDDVTPSTGAVANRSYSYTDTAISVTQWKHCTIEVVDKAERQSVGNTLDEFSSQFGTAIAKQQDTDIFGDHANITTNALGDATEGSVVDDTMLLPAIQKLDDLDVPEDDRAWYLPPVARKQLLKQDKFSLAYATGLNQGAAFGGGARKALGELYGAPVYTTSTVATSGNFRAGMYMHKEAYGAATQKNFTIEKLARVRKSTPISGDILYGYRAIRQNHAVKLRIDSDG